MMGWQWHQLDHKQTICTSRQATASTSSLNFYTLDALPDAKTTVSNEGDILHSLAMKLTLFICFITSGLQGEKLN